MKKEKAKLDKKVAGDKLNGEKGNGVDTASSAENAINKNKKETRKPKKTAVSVEDEKKNGAPVDDEAVAAAPDEEQSRDSERKKIDALEVDLKNEHDKYMRKAAEFENFRKRKEKEVQEAWLIASAETIKKFLPVLDDLERSLNSAKNNIDQNFDALVEGIELVQKTFLKALDSEKVERIKAVGEPFNPEFHEALIQMEKEGVDSDIVIDEHQPGYKVGDKVLRPAKVLVSK